MEHSSWPYPAWNNSVACNHVSPHSLPLLLVGTCPSEMAPTPTASEQAMRQENSPTIIFSPWASFHRGERMVGVLQICLFFLEYHTKVLWSSSPLPSSMFSPPSRGRCEQHYVKQLPSFSVANHRPPHH